MKLAPRAAKTARQALSRSSAATAVSCIGLSEVARRRIRRSLPLTLPLRGSLPLPASGERVGVRGSRERSTLGSGIPAEKRKEAKALSVRAISNYSLFPSLHRLAGGRGIIHYSAASLSR